MLFAASFELAQPADAASPDILYSHVCYSLARHLRSGWNLGNFGPNVEDSGNLGPHLGRTGALRGDRSPVAMETGTAAYSPRRSLRSPWQRGAPSGCHRERAALPAERSTPRGGAPPPAMVPPSEGRGAAATEPMGTRRGGASPLLDQWERGASPPRPSAGAARTRTSRRPPSRGGAGPGRDLRRRSRNPPPSAPAAPARSPRVLSRPQRSPPGALRWVWGAARLGRPRWRL